ncbi:MAG: aspartate/glutamate racemase family protein [Candidatus Bathyarchaeia archaeon]|nr:aspartate/glutamate racemase family protein [Candidatus Bathyarchaeota archaeon]
MKIQVIIPILKNEVFEKTTYKELSLAKRKDVELSVVSIEKGPASIESAYDEELAAPWILEKVMEAEKSGFDAVIIDCMGDPALNAAREIVKIPVIGPCQASMAIASTLCEKFSVVTVLKRLLPLFWRKVKEYGFDAKVASVRSVEVPVLELEEKRSEVKAKLLAESKKAVNEDGAGAIILGCTGMVGMAAELQEAIGIPVIDPAVASIKLAECLVDMKIAHSKLEYPEPPAKKRIL